MEKGKIISLVRKVEENEKNTECMTLNMRLIWKIKMIITLVATSSSLVTVH